MARKDFSEMSFLECQIAQLRAGALVNSDWDGNWIYLIQYRDTSNWKIGRTDHPEQRFKQLEIGKTCRLELYVPTLERFDETRIHRILKPRRLPQSEWFYIPEESLVADIKAAMQDLAQRVINGSIPAFMLDDDMCDWPLSFAP